MEEIVVARTVDGIAMQVNKKDLQMAVCLYGIVVQNGKILIVPQWKENGYDFPGGHLELGEKHIDGLVREVKEETGFIVKPIKIIDVVTSFFISPHRKIPRQCLLLYYDCEIVSGNLSTEGFDENEKNYAELAKFVTLKELKSMELQCSCRDEVLKAVMPYLEKRLSKN